MPFQKKKFPKKNIYSDLQMDIITLTPYSNILPIY